MIQEIDQEVLGKCLAVGASSRYLSLPWSAGIGIACLILGVALAIAPAVAFALTGLLLGLLLLQLPAYTWVIAAVLTATLSRLFVAGGVPPIVNFFHFPLALGAFPRCRSGSLWQRHIARRIAAGCITLLILSFASWVLSGGALVPSDLAGLWLKPFSHPLRGGQRALVFQPSAVSRKARIIHLIHSACSSAVANTYYGTV